MNYLQEKLDYIYLQEDLKNTTQNLVDRNYNIKSEKDAINLVKELPNISL